MTPSQKIQLPPLQDYIDGRFYPPDIPLGVWLENPNTGEHSQEQMATNDANLERALTAAWRVHQQGTWANMPLTERAAHLAAFSAELDKRKQRIAELDSFLTGTIINLNRMLGMIVTGAWHLAIEQMNSGWLHSTMPGPNNNLVHIHRKPWGPALILVAWNAPSAFMAHKGANSLAAGCPTILKTTEWAPHGCDVFGEAAHAAGMPPGVFQVVHGGVEVGKKLVADPRIRAISFTGGVEAGRSIAAVCAQQIKAAQLELGGNNPVIVMEDADLDFAADGIVSLMISLNGQWCRALGRVVVHENVHDALLDKVIDRFAAVKIGDSLDSATQLGPMIHSRHLQKITGQLHQLIAQGGESHSASQLPDLAGNFIAPTLVSGIDIKQAQDEIFGPIGTVHTFTSDSEMLALANGTPYGLEAYLFAGDEEKALHLGEHIHAGGVKINGASILSLNLMAPRPAWGVSGIHEEGTMETFRFFTNTRVVGVEGPLQFG